MKERITFTVKSKELKESLSKYAIDRGFDSIGSLSRFALFHYIKRISSKEASAVLHLRPVGYEEYPQG